MGGTFVGYVGVLSGQRMGQFSVTVDTRFFPGGVWQLFYEVVAAIEEKNSTLVCFETRDVVQYATSFDSAKTSLCPWFDDRYCPAVDHMKALGQSNVSTATMWD